MGRPKTLPLERKCQKCETKFKPLTKEQRYCSIRCGLIGNPRKKRVLVDQPCVHCGNMFRPKKTGTKYCSVKCMAEHRTFRTLEDKRKYAREWARRKRAESGKRQRRTGVIGLEYIDSNGYVWIKVAPGRQGWVSKHRYIMQQCIGRPLERGEFVHHKNGNKQDNRPENLELWTRHHPIGVRTSDI